MNKNFFNYNIPIEEYITGNGFIDICENTDAVFCKTDYIYEFSKKDINVFVTHNSDYEINSSTLLYAPKFKYWFAQNKNIDNINIISLPIGLENTLIRNNLTSKNGLFSSQVSGALQKSLLINKYNSLEIEKQNLLYMNFSVHTFPAERQIVYNLFEQKNWVTKTKNLSIEKLYFDIASHKFILSPRGNGIDCHRTWEALYLKTIPIVRNSIHMNEFKDLPIYFVNSWEEITEESLYDFYENSKNMLYNLDKLKLSYWKKIILDKLK